MRSVSGDIHFISGCSRSISLDREFVKRDIKAISSGVRPEIRPKKNPPRDKKRIFDRIRNQSCVPESGGGGGVVFRNFLISFSRLSSFPSKPEIRSTVAEACL